MVGRTNAAGSTNKEINSETGVAIYLHNSGYNPCRIFFRGCEDGGYELGGDEFWIGYGFHLGDVVGVWKELSYAGYTLWSSDSQGNTLGSLNIGDNSSGALALTVQENMLRWDSDEQCYIADMSVSCDIY